MWKTKNLTLTQEQKDRGVIFSSVLYCDNGTEPTLHEVMKDDPDKYEQIKLLKDVTFFKNMAKEFGWNVVEERRS